MKRDDEGLATGPGNHFFKDEILYPRSRPGRTGLLRWPAFFLPQFMTVGSANRLAVKVPESNGEHSLSQPGRWSLVVPSMRSRLAFRILMKFLQSGRTAGPDSRPIAIVRFPGDTRSVLLDVLFIFYFMVNAR